MAKVVLEFQLPDDKVALLVPSVGIYAAIYTAQGIVEIVNDTLGEVTVNRVVADGTDAIIRVVD